MPIQSDKELLHSSVSKYLPIIFIKNLKFGQIRVEKKSGIVFFHVVLYANYFHRRLDIHFRQIATFIKVHVAFAIRLLVKSSIYQLNLIKK